MRGTLGFMLRWEGCVGRAASLPAAELWTLSSFTAQSQAAFVSELVLAAVCRDAAHVLQKRSHGLLLRFWLEFKKAGGHGSVRGRLCWKDVQESLFTQDCPGAGLIQPSKSSEFKVATREQPSRIVHGTFQNCRSGQMQHRRAQTPAQSHRHNREARRTRAHPRQYEASRA
eukprot:136668-Chlamydomonas_euryale.AAC.7